MNVTYQIIVEVTADGMMGPLKVLQLVEDAVGTSERLRAKHVRVGHVRCAAIYPVAHDEQSPMAPRVPGSDQGREVEEIRDPRLT